MALRITTESGSIYIIRPLTKSWERIPGDGASKIRTSSGVYLHYVYPKLGERLEIVCPPLEGSGATARLIRSTKVISVDEGIHVN